MPLVLNPITNAGLISLAVAQSELAQSLPSDQSALAACISAATRAIQKYTKRDFLLTTYDELYTGKGLSSFLLRQYPVNSISRLAVNPSAVLTITNTDPNTNQRATAQLATTGDVDSGLTVTGITLNRWASGTLATNTISFTTGMTIQAIATAVNALGGGWSAVATQGYGLWPAADIRVVQGAQNTLNSSQAVFNIHVNDVTAYTLNELTGEVRLNNQMWDPIFALMNISQSSLLTVFPPGWLNIRCMYTAGYATIPYDVQQACLVTVKSLLYDLQTVTVYASENFKDRSYRLSDPDERGLPAQAKKLLQPWRSFRSF